MAQAKRTLIWLYGDNDPTLFFVFQSKYLKNAITKFFLKYNLIQDIDAWHPKGRLMPLFPGLDPVPEEYKNDDDDDEPWTEFHDTVNQPVNAKGYVNNPEQFTTLQAVLKSMGV